MRTIDSNKMARLGELLAESVAAGQIAGGNLCVVHRGEEIYYAESGYADIANQKKIARDSIFRLYSMTKPVTSAAVMLLMERGLLICLIQYQNTYRLLVTSKWHYQRGCACQTTGDSKGLPVDDIRTSISL